MDTAVALVKSYLQTNGFFTVTEYPILEMLEGTDTRSVTDIDVLALRFPGAGGGDSTTTTGGLRIDPDPILGLDESHIEVIIGEVKEGAAVLNKSARNPEVLHAVLRRFGQIGPDTADALVGELIATGTGYHPAGIRVRLMVFATKPPQHSPVPYEWVSLGRATTWLQEQVRENWDRVKTIQSKDPALGMLILFEKATRDER
ncbi:MAG TPA: hypothetical protein VLA29_05300 [Acidimicrobiia bacterium]|nr:hypothetical protein [Acidimicrobiia bacterium]